jgi:purine-nucleoside phosphorylase
MDHDFLTAVELARDEIHRQWPLEPRAAVILGTGLGRLTQHVRCDVIIPLRDLVGFPRTTAPGHRGRIVCGHLGSLPLILLDGRCHLYEGYSADEITLPVRVGHACGAPVLIVSNASGGLNPQYARGDVVVVDDHISFMKRGFPTATAATIAGRPERRTSSPYDEQLLQHAIQVARRHNFVAHRGVYVGVTGPNYETRAEYRFLRRIGGDVVGMSTVPEVTLAHALGMRVLGLSVVTNVASPDAPQVMDAADIIDAAAHAEPHVRQIVADIVATGGA